jgi:thiol-disulfide isomerase/thioredoxin
MGPGVGEEAVEIELEELFQAPEGTIATLEALKGKVVVIEFWATWCMPCVAAFPHMNELSAHYQGNDDIVFLSITDETRELAEKTLKDSPLGSWVGLDTDRSIFNAYGINAIPRTIIVGRDGRIAADTYPMLVNVESLDTILDGKAADLPSMADLLGEDDDGGGGMGMGMPQSIEEINQMQIADTVPGEMQQRLGALAGTWLSTSTVSPAGEHGPQIEGESEVYRRWIQGGRVLEETTTLEGTGGLVKRSYFGYDAEQESYYLCEISPRDSAPVIWRGEWNESESTLELERTKEIQLMGSPSGPKSGQTKSMTIYLYLSIDLSVTNEYRSTVSVDFGSHGMGMPDGEQVMSVSVGRRP